MRSFASIELRTVEKSYDDRRVLKEVSATFKPGQTTILLGSNGAGKSTLLRLLAGVSRSDEGQVLYDGHPLQQLDAPQFRACVAFLGHDLQCYLDLSPQENLNFFGKLYEVTALNEKISRWLSYFGLLDVQNHPLSMLSRGMLQRVALARTFLLECPLLLLDEPHTGLDQEGIKLLNRALVEAQQNGVTIILATHDFSSIGDQWQQVLVLREGRLMNAPLTKTMTLAGIYSDVYDQKEEG